MRQTGFAVAGVATGVGFSIMMASLMQGSQDDFTHRLINTLPHITVSDERRTPPPQPAEVEFKAAEIHGLTPEARRPGIKNPLATMAALEAWMPGGVAPSVKVQAIIRYANHDVSTTVTGIDPRRESKVSELPKQMRSGSLIALYRATNAIVIGDRLAEKIGARIGANITLQTSQGARITAQVVGLFHTGVRQQDEGTAYVLTKTGQILARQTGLINELRIRLTDPLQARDIAARVERDTGYKSVSWQEAYEDLLSTFIIRNIIMYAVVGAILLVASFGTYNIISTITHEKARDIAIMKSLGLREFTVRIDFRGRGADHRSGWGAGRLCARLSALRRARRDRDHQSVHRFQLPAARLHLRTLSAGRHGGAGVLGRRRLPASAQSGARQSGRDHPGRHMTATATQSTQIAPTAKALIEARSVTRILPGIVPTTLVHGINLERSRKTSSRRSPGRPARANPRCYILLGLLDLPTSGEVLIHGRATVHMAEEERALTRLTPARLRVPVSFSAAGIHHPRQRHAADARARAPIGGGHAHARP